MNLFTNIFLMIVSPTVGWERINKLSIDTSEVIVEGDISYLAYSDKESEKTKGSFMSKIFK